MIEIREITNNDSTLTTEKIKLFIKKPFEKEIFIGKRFFEAINNDTTFALLVTAKNQKSGVIDLSIFADLNGGKEKIELPEALKELIADLFKKDETASEIRILTDEANDKIIHAIRKIGFETIKRTLTLRYCKEQVVQPKIPLMPKTQRAISRQPKGANRKNILEILLKSPQNILQNSLPEKASLAQVAVSKIINELEDSCLITRKQRGTTYEIIPDKDKIRTALGISEEKNKTMAAPDSLGKKLETAIAPIKSIDEKMEIKEIDIENPALTGFERRLKKNLGEKTIQAAIIQITEAVEAQKDISVKSLCNNCKIGEPFAGTLISLICKEINTEFREHNSKLLIKEALIYGYGTEKSCLKIISYEYRQEKAGTKNAIKKTIEVPQNCDYWPPPIETLLSKLKDDDIDKAILLITDCVKNNRILKLADLTAIFGWTEIQSEKTAELLMLLAILKNEADGQKIKKIHFNETEMEII